MTRPAFSRATRANRSRISDCSAISTIAAVRSASDSASAFGATFRVPSETAPTTELADELRDDVHEALGALSRPHVVIFVEDLPTDISAAELGDAFHRLPESQARRDTILAAPAFRL